VINAAVAAESACRNKPHRGLGRREMICGTNLSARHVEFRPQPPVARFRFVPPLPFRLTSRYRSDP
jgi:hypothetical protein